MGTLEDCLGTSFLKSSLESPDVLTPYYSTLIPVDKNAFTEEYDYNYDSYNLFCLKKKLEPKIRKISPSYRVDFFSKDIQNKFMVTVKIFDGSEMILDDLDLYDKVRKLTSEALASDPFHVPIIDFNSVEKFPADWVISILPYLNVDNQYSPYISEDILYIRIPKVSQYIPPDSDDTSHIGSCQRYSEIYLEIYLDLIKQMNMLYSKGGIVVTRDFALQWKLRPLILKGISRPTITIETLTEYSLESGLNEDLSQDKYEIELNNLLDNLNLSQDEVDYHGLYIPIWQDLRFGNPVEFLRERLAGIPFKFQIESNEVVIYNVAKNYFKFKKEYPKFSSNYIILNPQNLDQLQTFLSLILSSSRKAQGRILNIRPSVNDIGELRFYIEIMKEYGREPVAYILDDSLKPYVVSMEIEYSTNIMETTDKIYSEYKKSRYKYSSRNLKH